jgi:predicted flap endonuclease-1-like 5' DNA nuclease
MDKDQSAVQWLIEQLAENGILHSSDIYKAKQMEKEQSHQYAEFAIRCDRKDMKILNFEDWIKL